MGITVSDSGKGNYEPTPEGRYQAVCYAVVDLGNQYSDYYNKWTPKVLIIWELPTIRIDVERDGETINLPRAISKIFTSSLHEKSTLRPFLESWKGRAFNKEELAGFELTKLLGVNCELQIIHKIKNDRTYAQISAILPLMDINIKKSPENKPVFFSFSDKMEIPLELPGWVIDLIKSSNQWISKKKEIENDFPINQYDDVVPF